MIQLNCTQPDCTLDGVTIIGASADGSPYNQYRVGHAVRVFAGHVRSVTVLDSSHSGAVDVVDEHGTLTGLVTLDDLLDELVGELEPDIDDVEIARTSPNSLTVKAAMDIEDFTEETGITLPEGDYHTLGGFVFHEFGRLPRRGDFITYEDHKFIVHEMAGRRIGALRVVGGPTREVS